MAHPFGELLAAYRSRKRGLTQAKLAQIVGYDPAVIARMAQGKLDLTGPTGRERVVRILSALRNDGVLHNLEEANALLATANMPPLYAGSAAEAALMRELALAGATRATAGPSNLPAPLTSFVDRECELADIVCLTQSARLVTLTGAGGTGKTRLALQVAGRLASTMEEGAYFVPLASVQRPQDVVGKIAESLDVREVPGWPLISTLTRFLSSRSVLLVLDNFEHVLDAAPVITDVLTAAPNVKLIATSRARLRLSGEHEFCVPPLGAWAAVTLFTHRARAACANFALDGDNSAVVAEICERVDRLPLAIELAAAHMRHCSPRALLAKLSPPSEESLAGARLGLLCDGPRDLDERQHTLRNTLDWSYQLLSAAEQRWFRRLGAFASGCELEQLVPLAQLDPEPATPPEVEAMLRALVDSNLLRAEALPDDGVRYAMPELIREYAWARLAEHGELPAMLRQHAEAFRALAHEREPHWQIQRMGRAKSDHQSIRVEREQDNIRAALVWCASEDAALGLALASRMWSYWWIGYATDGARWLTHLLDRAGQGAPSATRGRALLALANLKLAEAGTNGDTVGALQDMFDEAIDTLRRNDDPEGVAVALCSRARVEPDAERSRSLLQESVRLAREVDSSLARGWVLFNSTEIVGMWPDPSPKVPAAAYAQTVELVAPAGEEGQRAALLLDLGYVAMYQQDLVRAQALAEQALRTAQPMGLATEVAVLTLLGEAAQLVGDAPRAQACLERALAHSIQHGFGWEGNIARALLGRVARDRGDIDVAQHAFGEVLAQHPRFTPAIFALEGLACVAIVQGQAARAAQLFGAADAYRKVTHNLSWAKDKQDLAPYVRLIRAKLGPKAFEIAWVDGQAMTLERAVACALAVG